jgi:CheY-like chemotaxis protein
VTKEQQEKLFQVFSQATVSISKSYGGSGLGLAICKKLVEMMGGEIWIDSKVGVGTTMLFTLDCEEVKTSTTIKHIATKIKDTPTTHFKHKKMLLVDDSEDNRILIKEYLKNTNHVITEADNGENAIVEMKQSSFDIILMDMQMPVMDGYVATQKIREWEKQTNHSHTPIVAITANAMREEQDKCISVGCDLYLSKPILKKTLIDLLQNIEKN